MSPQRILPRVLTTADAENLILGTIINQHKYTTEQLQEVLDRTERPDGCKPFKNWNVLYRLWHARMLKDIKERQAR